MDEIGPAFIDQSAKMIVLPMLTSARLRVSPPVQQEANWPLTRWLSAE
jgi:hypothetical protein